MENAKELAKLVQKTAEIYESSFVKHQMKYGMTLREAAEQACPKELAFPVYLLLVYTWNDALDWASDTLTSPQEGAEK